MIESRTTTATKTTDAYIVTKKTLIPGWGPIGSFEYLPGEELTVTMVHSSGNVRVDIGEGHYCTFPADSFKRMKKTVTTVVTESFEEV